MKYLRKFQTNADYQAYKGGGDWVTPNVSLITGDNNIVYEPSDNTISLITFTIFEDGDGFTKQFTAEEGMTWEEWINSGKYDITTKHGNLIIRYAQLTTGPNAGSYVYVINTGIGTSRYDIYAPNDEGVCLSTEIIENGATYTAKGEK